CSWRPIGIRSRDRPWPLQALAPPTEYLVGCVARRLGLRRSQPASAQPQRESQTVHLVICERIGPWIQTRDLHRKSSMRVARICPTREFRDDRCSEPLGQPVRSSWPDFPKSCWEPSPDRESRTQFHTSITLHPLGRISSFPGRLTARSRSRIQLPANRFPVATLRRSSTSTVSSAIATSN